MRFHRRPEFYHWRHTSFCLVFCRLVCAIAPQLQRMRSGTNKTTKFSLSIFFDFWRRCVARHQKSKKMPSFRSFVRLFVRSFVRSFCYYWLSAPDLSFQHISMRLVLLLISIIATAIIVCWSRCANRNCTRRGKNFQQDPDTGDWFGTWELFICMLCYDHRITMCDFICGVPGTATTVGKHSIIYLTNPGLLLKTASSAQPCTTVEVPVHECNHHPAPASPDKKSC